MARILVVEDSPELRDLLALLLQEEGHDVVAVPGIGPARAELGSTRFDLVASDLSVDERAGPGDEDRAWLREAGRHAPVVVLTGRAWAPHVSAEELGVAAIVLKPFDLTALVAKTAEILEASGREKV